MVEEIKPNQVYTPKETREFLKISDSTMKRMIKIRLINAYKVSGQYRIWGREILKLVSPEVAIKGQSAFLDVKASVKKAIEKW